MRITELGTPMAYVLRHGLESHIPKRCHFIHRELGDAHPHVRTRIVPHGIFLEVVPADSAAARPLKDRVPKWTVQEASHLKQFGTDPVFVVTSKGILLSAKASLPQGWSIDAMPELTPHIYMSPGRLTAWANLYPVTPAGITLSDVACEVGKSRYRTGTQFYLETVTPAQGYPCLVVTHWQRGGRYIGSWSKAGLKLATAELGLLEQDHSLQVTRIPNLGWLIQPSSRAALEINPYSMPMPDLSQQQVYGKREAKSGLMRGHIRFLDIPNACLKMAGFKEGMSLAIERLPAGGVKLCPSAKAPQRVRRTHVEKNVLSFRLGVAELSWMQTEHVQAIVVEGAIFVLDARVPNDIPHIPDGATRDTEVLLPLGRGQTSLEIPADTLTHFGFVPGRSFTVKVGDNFTELRLDNEGPWLVGGRGPTPVVTLPRDLLYHVQSEKVRLTRSGHSSFKLSAPEAP